jgi:L-fuconate dehydratase
VSTFTDLRVTDIRFPTSQDLDGSDAMNPDPDYSAAYLELVTDAKAVDGNGGGQEAGHGFVFTIGRGNDVQSAAIRALAPHVLGADVEQALADPGAFSRTLVGDSQLRWLGPEKGVMHMAIGAVVNALWDLRARRAGEPLWLHLARMTPEEIVSCVDFRYLTDALTPDEALTILRAAEPGKQERIDALLESGFPAYSTTPGWLGYSDEKLLHLIGEVRDQGIRMIKLKVGGTVEDDERRLRITREAVGPDFPVAIDANQRWDVADAIAWLNRLAPFDPFWIEEPTSPDDVLGHAAIREGVAPVRVATGEQMQSRILAKQFLQADALDVLQIDATRVGGVNENLAMILLAAKFGVPVCPHAGGVGLCEVVQHLAMFDFVAVAGTVEGRWIEHVDHLHEHFDAPTAPGHGARRLPGSITAHTYPTGSAWKDS